MNITKKYLQVGTAVGRPQVVGEYTLSPESYVLMARTPVGGLFWLRPTAVWVARNGEPERLPIPDVTRYALLALGLWGLIAMGIGWLWQRPLSVKS